MSNNGRLLTKQLLLSDGYWVLNKKMVQLFGLEAAFLLSSFAEAEQMMADNDGWFYQTSDTVEEITTLSRHKQDRCIAELEDFGVLEKDVRGQPPKRYFRINYERLTNLFVNFQQIQVRETDKSICEKLTTNKEHTYKEPIDKERIYNNHPPSANKKSDLKRLEADFDRFWQIYPRKIARKKAKEDWLTKHKPSAELAEQIIHAVEQQKRTIWKNEDQQFIPHATTWLNQGRWEDELPKQKTHVGNFTVSDQSEKQIEEYQKEREATRQMTNAERSKYLYQKKLEREGVHG